MTGPSEPLTLTSIVGAGVPPVGGVVVLVAKLTITESELVPVVFEQEIVIVTGVVVLGKKVVSVESKTELVPLAEMPEVTGLVWSQTKALVEAHVYV